MSLDLGGGSTQITFAPKSNHVEGLEGRKHFMHEVNVLQNMIKVRNKITHVRCVLIILQLIFVSILREEYFFIIDVGVLPQLSWTWTHGCQGGDIKSINGKRGCEQ